MLVVPLAYGDPIQLFRTFADDPVAALLHSAAPDAARGRYSYIAAEPYEVLRADTTGVTRDGRPVAGGPFAVLAQALADHAGPTPADAPVPFTGGAVGFLSYELGRHVERLPAPRPGPPIPDLLMGLYDVVLAFDHVARAAWLLSSGLPERTEAARTRRAKVRADAILARLAAAPPAPALDWSATARWTADLERAEMEARIARAVDYIHAGDIFQANITQIFRAPCPDGLSDYDLYRRLTALSPAPFSALLTAGPDLAVISASPERFLRLSPEGIIETRPIKGTRPRGADPREDERFAAELRDSAKDRAENLMIVDLMRNDLGRVSRLGSVEVPQLCALETFASVHHLVSEVRAHLRPGLGAVDLLRASFPGGSITGAPKVRAMEIIHELEPAPRGVYCGAIGWIGFDGAMDSSIVIRTLTRTGQTLMAQAGGGIVADSDPAAEYEESLIKMQPLLRAVTGDAP
ncbi:para-aminobenzoate synthase [Azorhizobium oxalatiphilum]|uniref:aminodeoxychorismate synthase n=1 Tax=Azorhizobium oxalatiphilum TaxID=980631 RepID=A0A917F8S0_9HYPH|nr:aminodeoxychorismate synthase component I [Azorhizobium oxalatiphilum]GGF56054.1 para-aminobenzoate synthase [Azorhizobium oxalatiphilum]